MSSTLRDTILAHRSRRTEPITEASEAASPAPSVEVSANSSGSLKKGRGGKSSDPRYQKVGIFVRRDTIEAIQRHQIGKKEDLSDFVERALEPAIKKLNI